MFFFHPPCVGSSVLFFFFFNDTATTEIYTLSLHDALPIFVLRIGFGEAAREGLIHLVGFARDHRADRGGDAGGPDRKSTRLNSSHMSISYAVFCLKKKKKKTRNVTVHKEKHVAC